MVVHALDDRNGIDLHITEPVGHLGRALLSRGELPATIQSLTVNRQATRGRAGEYLHACYFAVGFRTMRRTSMIPRPFFRTRRVNACFPAFLKRTLPNGRSTQF